MANNLDPVLYRTPLLDASGRLTREWIRFFSSLATAANVAEPAGAATAAVTELLASSHTWTGAQTFNNNLQTWGELNIGYAINWANASVRGTAQFTNDMQFPFSNGFWYASPNAPSWYEFRSITSQGAALANDYLGWQYNSRTTAGGTDSWHDSFQLAALTGQITFYSPVNFQQAPTFADAATTRTNLGLGTAATQPSTAFDAAGAASTVQAASLQKTSNLSDLANAATARANLGLGTAALQNMTNFAAYTPTVSASGSMTVSGVNVNDAEYMTLGPLLFVRAYVTYTLGGTASNTIYVTMPQNNVVSVEGISCQVLHAGANWQPATAWIEASESRVKVMLPGLPNFALGVGGVLISGFYRIS